MIEHRSWKMCAWKRVSHLRKLNFFDRKATAMRKKNGLANAPIYKIEFSSRLKHDSKEFARVEKTSESRKKIAATTTWNREVKKKECTTK